MGGTAVRVLRYPPHWSAVAPPSAAAPAAAAASADAADGSDAGTRYSDTGTPRDGGGGHSDTGTPRDAGTPRGGGGGSRPLWFHAVVTGLRPESQSVDLEYAPVP